MTTPFELALFDTVLRVAELVGARRLRSEPGHCDGLRHALVLYVDRRRVAGELSLLLGATIAPALDLEVRVEPDVGPGIDYEPLPEGLREGMQRYIEQGIPTGSFLRAVLQNDLADACRRADVVNRYRLVSILEWLDAEAPSDCFGSPERVEAWLRTHKARRQAEREREALDKVRGA